MSEAIHCPIDLNKYLIAPPLFENTFADSECEKESFTATATIVLQPQ